MLMKIKHNSEEESSRQSPRGKDWLFRAKYQIFDFFVQIITTYFIAFSVQTRLLNETQSGHYHLLHSRNNDVIHRNRIISLMRGFVT